MTTIQEDKANLVKFWGLTREIIKKLDAIIDENKESYHNVVRFRLKTGESFFFNFNSHKNRIRLYVVWPRNKETNELYMPHYPAFPDGPTFSVDRNAESVAKSIKNNEWFAKAITEYNKQKEILATDTQYIADTKRTSEDLQVLLNNCSEDLIRFTARGAKIDLTLDNLSLMEAKEIISLYKYFKGLK